MKRTKFQRKHEKREGVHAMRNTKQIDYSSKTYDQSVNTSKYTSFDVLQDKARLKVISEMTGRERYIILTDMFNIKMNAMVLDKETVLEPDYPVYAGRLYVVNGYMIESMITGTVKQLIRDLNSHGMECTEVRRCEIVPRQKIYEKILDEKFSLIYP